MMQAFSLSDVEQSFKEFLNSIGHFFNSQMKFDIENWLRYDCPLASKGNQNISYKAHSDKQPCLKVQCHKCHPETITFKYDGQFQFTATQRQIMTLESEKRKSASGAARKVALKLMQAEWDNARSCMSHPYFERKNLLITESDGLRIDDRGRVLCPIKLITGDLVSTQSIPFKGKKLFHKGASPKNGFHTLGALEVAERVYFAEGMATALSIRNSVNEPVICVYGKHFSDIAPIIKKAYPKKKFIYCCDLPADGEPVTSEDNAKKAIVSVGGTYVLPDFSTIPNNLKPDIKRSDFNDLFVLLIANGLDRTAALNIVRQKIQQHLGEKFMAEDSTTQKENLIDQIKQLASLDKMAYELVREKAAKELNIRIVKLDEFVDDVRKITEEEKSVTVLFPKIEPWPEAVVLSLLLDELVAIFNKYVSFNSEHEPNAIALWVIHTYCIEAAYITPILFITSAEMRSGKSTVLAILQKTVSKCVAASSISPSALYRLIPKHHPSLVCDEADTYMTEKNEDLRGVLNAGHSRDTSGVLRTNPETLEVERFDAFGAKCLAAIKGLPNTVEDRSIIIRMRRKAKEQKTEKLRLINEKLRKEFNNIQRKCIKFADDNVVKLKACAPTLPDKLNDRAADNWYALFQIATLAGDKWLDSTKKAALHISGIEQESKSLGIELLEDILNLSESLFKNGGAITTAELIDALCADEEAPWVTYNSKRQDAKISARQLANLLAPYGIKSINNIGIDKRKGYSKASFQDAFARYTFFETPDFTLLPAPSAQINNDGACTENEEKNSAAPIRYPLQQDESLAQEEVADSRLERTVGDVKKTLETPPNEAGADIADKSDNSSLRDYMDV